MVKIILKTIVLIFIILSIYFIVNPSACSNLMLGRVVNDTTVLPTREDKPTRDSHLTMPADKPLPPDAASNDPASSTTESAPATHPAYTQDDIDYAIASRYVELENEYLKKDKLTKNAAKEIAYMVMDDFELTQQEWEDFLERATENNLFDKVRKDVEITHQKS